MMANTLSGPQIWSTNSLEKVKEAKFALRQAVKAHKRSRYIALLFL
jgi:hypothetical protein